ncbi:MAG: MBL fold metallo-hydrolase [Polyangiaceae bacterium]|nr:MBL fold metallo-hydrolase [Polyangiaceae bacterium]
MKIQAFHDPATFTLTYVVHDPQSKDAVVIDSVLDYDPLASETATTSLEKVAAFLRERGLRLHYVLETHAHADHLSGAQWLKRRFEARTVIGENIRDVQETFEPLLDMGADVATNGSQFDRLVRDGEVFDAGTLRIEVIGTPGHTPACVTYKIGDAIFTGDALFIEDYGTGRCDFPKGDAAALYTSVHDKLYRLPDETRVFVGHDYEPGGRDLRYETTIGISKRSNIQLRDATTKQEFVSFRVARDATLQAPRLLYPSVRVNLDAGRLPKPRANGVRYLAIPLNAKAPTRDDGASSSPESSS